MISDPTFDFDALMQDHVEDEDALEAIDMYNPFNSHSPLLSPLTTPCASYAPSPLPFTEDTAKPPSPSFTTEQPPLSGMHKSHSKWQSCENWKWKCCEWKAELNVRLDPDVPSHLRSKHTHATEPVVMEFNLEDALHASSGYIGLVEESWKWEHTLEELTGPKFKFWHCEWQGQWVLVHFLTTLSLINLNQLGHPYNQSAGSHYNRPGWSS